MRTRHAQLGGRLEKSAVALLLAALVIMVSPSVAHAHDDPPGDKITDFAAVTEVWTDQSWDDGLILSDAELCIIAIFQHPNHDRYSMTVKTKLGDQTLETVVPYFDVVEKCNDDVNMNGSEAHRNSLPWYDQATGRWRLIGGSSNGITNVLQGSRHDECSLRAPWTINVQGFEHSEDAAEIFKKIAKALEDASGLVPDAKWKAGSKAGAALAEFIASLFSNIKIGEVTLDFPPTDDGPKTASGAHLLDVTAHVSQESREGGAPCGTASPTPTATASPTLVPTPTVTETPVPPATPTSPDTTVPTPTTPDTAVPTPTTPDTSAPTPSSLVSAATAGGARAEVLDCGADEQHVFAKRLGRAARSWQALAEAAALLPTIGTIPDEDVADVPFVRELLATTIVDIGRIVAAAEVAEAAGSVSPTDLAHAEQLLAEGDDFRDQALPAGDATLIAQALARYRSATELLLPLLHPDCQVAPEVACQRAVLRASADFGQAKLKALADCALAKLKGNLPFATSCDADATAVSRIAKAAENLRAAIAKGCGGKDKTCGGDGASEAPAALGFDPACKGLTPAACGGALADCSGVADCLTCGGDAAVDRLAALTLTALAPTNPKVKAEKPLNKCQRALVQAVEGFFVAKSEALAKCWDHRAKGKHANACPVPGEDKTAATIAKAHAKVAGAICKACGGDDKTCDGSGDFAPSAIGFPSACDDVQVPDGARCAGPISTLADLTACVQCMTEYTVDCLDAAAVPDFATYPAECRP